MNSAIELYSAALAKFIPKAFGALFNLIFLYGFADFIFLYQSSLRDETNAIIFQPTCSPEGAKM
jgi:hypothetical protein